MADLIGTTVGNYRIESLLGTGGMGQVYLGVHAHLNRPAAVKVMHAHLAGEESFKRRFRQEARAVAALSHPHIVQTWDFGAQGGNFYLVMELLTDGSLRSLVHSAEAREPGWMIHVGLDLVRQAAEGLAYAHNRGMVHRDIKPDNLLLQRLPDDDFGQEDGHGLSVKITDFGLARMTEEASATGPSLVMGTPAFMSPELCQGLPLDGRSDLYSLGVVLYQVLTGHLPFETRAAAEAVYKHVHAMPPRPSEHWPEIPPVLEEIVLRCLAKDPDERFESSAMLARALRGAREELAAHTTSPVFPVNGAAGYRTTSPPPVVRPMPTPDSAAVAQIVVSGDSGGARQVVELGIDGLVVGSLPDNDLVLGDTGVFGRHARIDWDGEMAAVTDLGSSTGTTLGSVALMPHLTQPWNLDDELRIGTRRLRLKLPGSGAHSPAPVLDGAGALTDEPADAATMAVARRNVALASQPSRLRQLRRLPALAAVAVIAVLLSVGGIQALSFGGDGDADNDAASLIAVDDSAATGTAGSEAVVAETETPAATETASPQATSTREPASTKTSTPTRTPTVEPAATEPPPPPSPPPAPTETPVPPTTTAPPATATAVPEVTPSPEGTVPAESTVPPEPTEAPAGEPTASVEPTAEPGGTAAPEQTTEAYPGSQPGPIATPPADGR